MIEGGENVYDGYKKIDLSDVITFTDKAWERASDKVIYNYFKQLKKEKSTETIPIMECAKKIRKTTQITRCLLKKQKFKIFRSKKIQWSLQKTTKLKKKFMRLKG